MLPAANGKFQLIDANKASDAPLASGTAYQYSSYFALPEGKYRLAVIKAGTTAPLKTFDVELKENYYFTILVAPERVELIDDTAVPEAQSATVTIRNFFPSVPVSASIGGKPVLEALSYGQSRPITGLAPQRTTITVRASVDDKPVESEIECDLIGGKRATLLVIPDSYGRFRPRITQDGTSS